MKSPTTTEFYLNHWRRFARQRGTKDNYSPNSPAWLGMIASIIYLCWRDSKTPSDSPCGQIEPTRPVHDRQWERIKSLAGNDLVMFLSTQVPTFLAAEGGASQELRIAIGEFLHRSSNQIDPESLKYIVDSVDGLNLGTRAGLSAARDLLDEASDRAIRHDRYFGVHSMPPAVSELMIELVDPRPGERIYNPCSGVGGLLVRCSRHAEKHRASPQNTPLNNVEPTVLTGCETNGLGFMVVAIRVLLEEHCAASLIHGDALSSFGPLFDGDLFKQGFDVILTCPSWGKALRPVSKEQFVVSSSDNVDLFLQHVVSRLRDGGRAVVAVTEGTLFRGGPTRLVRKWLLENVQVEGVVSLPRNTFAPSTNVKANLLLLRKTKPGQHVRFCVVHALKGLEGQQHLLGSESAAEIGLRYRDTSDTVDAWSVPVKAIAERNHELVAKQTGSGPLGECLNKIEADTENAHKVELGSIARIFMGSNHDSDNIVESQFVTPQSCGIVRISDLKNGALKQPSQFLLENDKQARLLEDGDIVLSVSGTIGRAAIVRNSSRPLVASRGIGVIRLKRGFQSEHLLSLLESDSYRNWLVGHAHGATIQHLTRRTLERMPLAVRSQGAKKQIITGDQFATGAGRDPVDAWLMESEAVSKWKDYKPDGVIARASGLIEGLAISLQKVRDAIYHRPISVPDSQLAEWSLQLAAISQGLRGLTLIPEGAGLLAVLDNGRSSLADTLATLKHENTSARQRAFALTRKIADALDAMRRRLLDRIEMTANVTPAAVPAGATADVVVSLRNVSPLAIRAIVFHASNGYMDNDSCGYLDSLGEHRLSISLPAQAEGGNIDFEVFWRGRRLDGKETDGRIALRVAVLAAETADSDSLSVDLGPSPYIVGNPIDRKEMLFGREEQIDRIVRQLKTSEKANVVLLEGNRRTGKTSILKRLADPTTLPGLVAINISFQGGEGVQGSGGLPTAEVYRLMAKQIGWQAYEHGVEAWLPGIARPKSLGKFKPQFAAAVRAAFTEGNSFEMFELYLQEIFAVLGEDRLLLMLDEFDKLQEGIEAGVTSPQVPENIRYLIHTYPQLSAVLSGGRQLKGLRAGYWSALFGFGHRVDVSALPLAAARRLVTDPLQNRLVYVDEARDRLIDLCARHPFLLQSLCNHVFEAAVREDVRTITVPFVESAATALIRDNEHFHTLWNYAGSERRRFILALINRHPNNAEPISFELITAALEEAGIQLPRTERLGDDIDWLCELELVRRDAGELVSYYQLAVPLFGKWISVNIDFDDLMRRAVKESQEYL